MSVEHIFDAQGRRAGYRRDSGNYVYAYGPRGENVGYFSKSADYTFDHRGRRYGRGDLLVALIMRAAEQSR